MTDELVNNERRPVSFVWMTDCHRSDPCFLPVRQAHRTDLPTSVDTTAIRMKAGMVVNSSDGWGVGIGAPFRQK
jgi:hypothetical protein